MKGWVEKHESSVVCVSALAWRSGFHHSLGMNSVFAAAGCSESQDSHVHMFQNCILKALQLCASSDLILGLFFIVHP